VYNCPKEIASYLAMTRGGSIKLGLFTADLTNLRSSATSA